MKALLGLLALLLAGSGYGAYTLYLQVQKARETIHSLTPVAAEKSKLEAQNMVLTSELDRLQRDSQFELKRTQDDLKATKDKDQQQIDALKASQDQLQKDFDAYKIKYRTDARARAVGQKLDQLVTAKQTYTGVTIKGVDPAGIDIIHDSGAARISFMDLSDEWRDRLAYNPDEEKTYLAKETAETAAIQAKAQADYAAFLRKQDQAKQTAAKLAAQQNAAADRNARNQLNALRDSLRALMNLEPITIKGADGTEKTIYPTWYANPEDDPEISAPTSKMYDARTIRDQILQLVGNN